MVVWEIVEAPHGRYNTVTAERLASSILAEAIERLLLRAEAVDAVRAMESATWLPG